MFRAMRFLHNAAGSVGMKPRLFPSGFNVAGNFALRSCNESQYNGILPGMRKPQSSRSRMREHPIPYF